MGMGMGMLLWVDDLPRGAPALLERVAVFERAVLGSLRRCCKVVLDLLGRLGAHELLPKMMAGKQERHTLHGHMARLDDKEVDEHAHDHDEPGKEQEDAPNAQEESLLKLAAVGPIERLIISDEGKSPKIFHEFKNIALGWEKSIPFSKSFRCYSSSLQHIRFAVDDGIEKQVNGKGAGNFSWSGE